MYSDSLNKILTFKQRWFVVEFTALSTIAVVFTSVSRSKHASRVLCVWIVIRTGVTGRLGSLKWSIVSRKWKYSIISQNRLIYLYFTDILTNPGRTARAFRNYSSGAVGAVVGAAHRDPAVPSTPDSGSHSHSWPWLSTRNKNKPYNCSTDKYLLY